MTRCAGLLNYEDIFDEASVEGLIKIARSRVPIDRLKLREGLIRTAKARAERLAGTANAVRRQIEALHSAAGERNYDKVADLVIILPASAWEDRAARARRFATVRFSVELELRPVYLALAELREQDLRSDPLLGDPSRRNDVCVAIEDICQHGGGYVLDRNRPSGRRSRPWRPLLMAPEMQEHPQIRRPERAFVMWLQLAWLDATGKMPPLTAHRAKPGPFARLAQAALAVWAYPMRTRSN